MIKYAIVQGKIKHLGIEKKVLQAKTNVKQNNKIKIPFKKKCQRLLCNLKTIDIYNKSNKHKNTNNILVQIKQI